MGSKCDGCADRVAEGLAPMCVEACPMRALTFGDASEVPDGFERADIAPLPSASETEPNLYILPARNAKPADDKSGWVANLSETM